MGTENRIGRGQRGRYENLEIFADEARRLRSEAVCGMVVDLISRLKGAFGNLAASPVTVRPALPTAGKARPQGSAV